MFLRFQLQSHLRQVAELSWQFVCVDQVKQLYQSVNELDPLSSMYQGIHEFAYIPEGLNTYLILDEKKFHHNVVYLLVFSLKSLNILLCLFLTAFLFAISASAFELTGDHPLVLH